VIDALAACGFVVALWWGSTAALLRLSRAEGAAARWAMLAMTALAGAAVAALAATASVATVPAAYLSFSAGLALWGWLELSFLLGFVVGAAPAQCPPNLSTGARFQRAFATLWKHELALAGTAVLLVGFSWGAENALGAQAFAALWLLRISAKLNVFFGAPNLAHEFLPARLSHLASYCGAGRRITPFFAFSATAGAAAFGALVAAAAGADAAFAQSALALIAALVGLGLLEHWFLVLPTPDAALWRWALPAGDAGRTPRGVASRRRIPFSPPAAFGVAKPAPLTPGKPQ